MAEKITYSAAERARVERRRVLCEAFERAPINRDALKALALADRLERVLDRMSGGGPADVLAVWKAAGLWDPLGDPGNEEAALLDSAQALSDEANGFRWALSHFRGAIEVEAHEPLTWRRRRESAEARRDAADAQEASES